MTTMYAAPVAETQTRSREMRWVVLIGIASGLLYAVVYFAQRAIYLNGLILDIAGVFEQGAPASRSRLYLEAGTYYLATIALFGLYGWLLALVRRDRLRDPLARRLAVAFPVVFNLALLIGRPTLSIDIFSYIAHGFQGTTPGNNPYAQAVSEIVRTPFGRSMIPFGWRPVHGISPYGPLWTHYEILVFRLTQDIPTLILLLKLLVVTASLLSGWMIWKILGHVRPRDQLFGTLVYLWNPMIVVEFGGEGHNDALMIVFVLLAVLLTVRSRPAASMVALILGVMAKFVPLILLPAQFVYFWRQRGNGVRSVALAVLGLGIGIGVAFVLYRPFWIGMETFRGVREHSQPSFLASTSVPLLIYLQRTHFEPQAVQMTSRIIGAIFAVIVLISSLRVRDEESFLRACATISLLYLLVASPGYWPWYAALPLALMALTPHGVFYWMIFILTFCSRVTGPIDDMAVNGFGTWDSEVWSTTVIGLLIPLMLLLILAARAWMTRSRKQPLAASHAR